MSIVDAITPKPHIEAANGILNIQKLAIQMDSFGAKKRIDIWFEPVDEFTLDYLSAYFGTSIQKEDKTFETGPYLMIRNEYSDIYVQLKEN